MLLIYSVVFLGFFASALVSPVFSPLFLHPRDHGVLSPETDSATRVFLLGLTLGVMRLGEFVGSPLLGRLSDRRGRKPVLAGVMLFTAVGNLAIAVAIPLNRVSLIVVAQFVVGFAGVLLVLAQAEVAARSRGLRKTRQFGLIYMACSLAYVLAPIVGGHLADVGRFAWASWSLPFLVAAGICLLCVALIWWWFPEPGVAHQAAAQIPGPGRPPMRFWQVQGFGLLLLVNFLLYLGIDFVFQFNPVFFVQKWEMTASHVGWLISGTSLSMVLAQWLLVKPAGQRWPPRVVTAASGFLLAMLLILQVIPENWWWLLLILPGVGASMALATTNMSALLSNTAPARDQGRLLGLAHSVRVLGSALLCFAGGLLAGFSPRWPIVLAAIATLAAVLLLRVGQRARPLPPPAAENAG